MIETVPALDAVEQIAAMAQLDGLFVGPSDLGIALGLGPGASREHPLLAQAMARVLRAAQAAGKVAGIWCGSAEMARAMADLGYRLLVPGHDNIWRKAEIGRRLAALRGV